MSQPRESLKQEDARPFPSPPEGHFEPEDEVDLLAYIEVIVRRRWLIFWGLVGCALAAFGYTRMQPVSYQARATVLPSQERDLKVDGGSAQVVRHSGKYLETLKGFSVGYSMLQRTVPRTADGRRDSTVLGDFFNGNHPREANLKRGLDGLATCSEFKQDASGAITISITMRDPVMAAAVANAYVEELILFYTQKQQKQAMEDVAFIHSRLRSVAGELRTAEDSLVTFQRSNLSIQDPELVLYQAHLKRQVDLKSSLYTTLATQYELARIEARKDAPTFEVLNYARPTDAVPSTATRKRTILLGAAVGLFLFVFLAFLGEYIEQNLRSGRLDPILDELRKDVDRARRLVQR